VPSPAPRASRRAVLTGSAAAGAALLTGVAAGCGVLQGDETTDPSAVDPSVAAVDADSDLVETVGAQITTALALAGATGSAFDQLRPLTRRLVSLHRSHLGELGQPDAGADGTVKGSPATARARLLRSEEQLQQHLVRAALEAESGALAQVFASMAAAIAQERAVAQ
jgi:hypothetical protein